MIHKSIFDYCDIVWSNLNKGLANKVQKLQNRAARVITFQGYDVRSLDLLKYLKWDDLALRRNKRLSSIMFDTVNYNTPEYLRDLFSLNSINNPYKSRLRHNVHNLSIDYIPKSENFKKSFSYRGMKNWNSLPFDFKTLTSKVMFKRKLSTYEGYPPNCYDE